MSEKILLIGGGGHCKSILDSLFSLNTYSEIGIIDCRANVGKSVMGIPVVGCDDDLRYFHKHGYLSAFVSMGSIGNPGKRIGLFGLLTEIGFEIPNIFDPSAIISHNLKTEKGVFVGKNSVINTSVKINKGAIINSGAIIEHDCVIGEFAHIATGSILCGGVQIGAKTHIGAGSVVKQNITIGSNSLIGMGSVVLHDIGDDITAFGNPCPAGRPL